MNQTKVIVLDFDNCLVLDEETGLGSEEIKGEAWFVAFPEHPRDILNPVLEHAKRLVVAGKGDRKDIAREVLLRCDFSGGDIEGEVLRRCESFNAHIQQGIRNISISPKVRKALADLQGRYPLYVNTATPREAVMESLETLDLLKYFKAILGRPGTKAGNLREIISIEHVKPEEVRFVDDQVSGWNVAQEIGCQFVGIRTARNILWHTTLQPFPIVKSLAELVDMM